MENILNDALKIKFYAQLQKDLCNLKPNSSEEEITTLIINQIPETTFQHKDELMIICQLFAYYPRNNSKSVRRNAFKLFEKIMDPIKNLLQGESSFFWHIFGGLYYFKQYMYEEGLISIEKIVQEAIYDNTKAVAEFFLPEIVEKCPEIYEKEIKYQMQRQYSADDIEKFKELRKKHLKWLRESNDYFDPLYREIETDQLRYCIKTDDIDTFQTIVSNLNLSINSKIKESILENSYLQPAEVSFIDFAIEFNSIKIFKYLIMNDAKIEMESVFNAIRNRNYEMIHLVESKNEQKFIDFALSDSISCWNYELILYSIENYENFFDDEEISSENVEKALDIMSDLCYSINFQFLESIYLPFLKNHSKFVHENINEILFCTIQDQSGYFTKEFMKYPGIDVNYHSPLENNKSLLCKAIQQKNKNAVFLFLSHPEIELGKAGCDYAFPFQFACGAHADVDIIQMICNHPKFDINWRDNLFHFTAFDICILRDNFYTIEFILNRFPDYDEDLFLSFFMHCLTRQQFLVLKLILEFTSKKNEGKIKNIIDSLPKNPEFNGNKNEIMQIMQELKIDDIELE